MKKKKWIAIMALTIGCTLGLSACGPDNGQEQVAAEATPTPTEAPTPTPTPEPTPVPEQQTTTYTSADGMISLELPDVTWSNKMDSENLYSFASAEQGSILIEHGQGEEVMSAKILPETQDTAVVLEQGTGLTEGTDFEIQNYTAVSEEDRNIYSYVVKMLNTAESEYAYKVAKVIANDTEYFSLTALVTSEDSAVLADVQTTFNSFRIAGETSGLRTAPVQAAQGAEGTESTGTEGENTADGNASEETVTGGPTAEGGIVPYRDNPDNTDNTKTRTIYRNSDGSPLVISINAEGVWVDANGNQYRFTNECDVYDQNDVDYYYHGEAADVYYMPVEQ